MRFAIGDLIIYGETGVCRVADIVEKEFLDGKKNCYQLQPIYQSCMIFTPADNEAVFMRPIMTREEADDLLERICSIEPTEITASNPRELSEKYDAVIKSHNCEVLVSFAKSIYAKRERLIATKKKLSAVDERYMKRAEDLLFGEIAASLGIERIEVKETVSAKLK